MGLSTAGNISVGGTALGGGIQALGSFMGGMSGKAQAGYQSAVLYNNKILADRAAEQALEKGAVAAQIKQVDTANLIGQQRASLAGKGVVVDQDTALALTLDASRIGKLDEVQILNNAQREAYALKLQGANFASQAKAAKAAGKDAFLSGLIGAGGTLIGTAGNVAAKWLVYKDKQAAEDEGLGY